MCPPNDGNLEEPKGEHPDRMSWPEDQEKLSFIEFITDRLLYMYMNRIFDKGVSLHRMRRQLRRRRLQRRQQRKKENRLSFEDDDGDDDDDYNDDGKKEEELGQHDLYHEPHSLESAALSDEFFALLAKNTSTSTAHNSSSGYFRFRRSNQSSVVRSKKGKRRQLLYVLWKIAAPTFVPGGFYEFWSTLFRLVFPLCVKGLLVLLEKEESVVNGMTAETMRLGVLLVVGLFLGVFGDAVTQERHRYLSFETGIRVRAAVATSIYRRTLSSCEKSSKTKKHNVNNLVAIDCQKLFEVWQEGHLMWSCPSCMVAVCGLLLWHMGPATLAGMGFMFFVVPFTVKQTVGVMVKLRRKRTIHTDARMESTSSMLQAMRYVKLARMEDHFVGKIKKERRSELGFLRKELGMLSMVFATMVMSPVFATALTFVVYVSVPLGTNRALTPSDAFTALLFFSVLRFPINYAGRLLGKVAQGLESLNRLSDFFEDTQPPPPPPSPSPTASPTKDVNGNGKLNSDEESLLSIIDGTFGVGGNLSSSPASLPSNGTNGDETIGPLKSGQDTNVEATSTSSVDLDVTLNTPEEAIFSVSGVNLSLSAGETLAVLGPVGSGKTTLLVGLLRHAQSQPVSKRPRLAYASQTPFIRNATLRENVTFGRPFREVWYRRVLEACGLVPDLAFLPRQDLTEIGERGVTLSGGQKARVSLARCVYAQPDVMLLDDVLSALDASTAAWVLQNLLPGKDEPKLLPNTAIVLVTHAAQWASRVDRILVLVDGRQVYLGPWVDLDEEATDDDDDDKNGVKGGRVREVLESIRSSVQEEGPAVAPSTNTDTNSGPTGTSTSTGTSTTVMTIEGREFGRSDWRTWYKWFQYAGGVWFLGIALFTLFLDRFFYVGTEWWLAIWTDGAYEPVVIFNQTYNPQTFSQKPFLEGYGIILLLTMISTIARSSWIMQGGARCSAVLFNKMLDRLVCAPMSYFESVPTGRILNRLSYDVEQLDIIMSESMTILMVSSGWLITGIIVQTIILPWSLCVLVPVTLIYFRVLGRFRKSGVDLQRLDAVSRSPVQARLAEGVDGSVTVRAFDGAPEYFKKQFESSMDENTAAMMNYMAAQRWLGVRFQLLGSLVVLFVGLFVVLSGVAHIPGIIAMLIVWSSNFTTSLGFFSKGVSETESAITSVERVCDLAETLEQEGKHNNGKNSPPPIQDDPLWPRTGTVTFERVSMRYRPGLPLALKDLSFTIPHGQRVGIVGRSGAGKSTLVAALGRLCELDAGTIRLDGTDLSRLPLSRVRGAVCVVPQDPVLFAGTLARCLDPQGSMDGPTLREALDAVGMTGQPLDDVVEEGGSNYSVGERQLLSLARAVLARPSLLVLDEATSSVDADTDAKMGRMLKDFAHTQHATVLIIAHRLHTVMDCDVVMVMDHGTVVERGPPADLLQIHNGYFAALVEAQGAMAHASSS